MFIKLTLICMAFAPLIIGKVSENPAVRGTRVGKLFGWLAVSNDYILPLKFITSANRRWQGELSLTLGRRPLIASVAFYRGGANFRIEQHESSAADVMSDDSNASNATPGSVAYITTTSTAAVDELPLDSTTEAMPSALKLEDYEDITFQPKEEEANRLRREAVQSNSEDVSRATTDDELDSTTIESSTIPVNIQENDSPHVNLGSLTPPAISSSNQHFYYVPSLSSLPYPPSSNPSAQHVSITYPPHHKPRKDFYEFQPSQPDFTQQFAPYCNSIYRKFTPIASYDVWPNYHKWK